MAKYTIELRTIVESGRNIFPFEYEFYDETKRAEFERDFIRHFYFHEIGVETVDRFILNLEDKMQVVFPAYNEALKALSIEYNILDNYFLSETTNRTVKTDGKTSGVSSTRGQVFDEQQTETNENRTADTTTNENGTTTTENNGTTTTENNGTTTTENGGTSNTNGTNKTTSNTSETANGTSSKTGSGSSTVDESNVKKFLDTPQGALNLEDVDYLTNLTEDTHNGTTETENDETVTDERETTGTGTTNTETESETTSSNTSETSTSDTSETTSNDASETATERNSTNKETATGKTDATFSGQQKTTADNNTRTNRNDTTTETTEVIHKGNVGVDSDAVMIQKHLKLQQLIANTKKLFFAECEDLFMLVY